MALIEKYEVSEEKQENLNEVTNRRRTFRIMDTSQDPDIWSNALYNSNLRFKKTKEKYEKDEDDMKAHVFYVLPE